MSNFNIILVYQNLRKRHSRYF